MGSPLYEAPVEETTFMLCKPDVSHLHLEILQEVIDNGFQVQAKNFRITPMVAAIIASHFPSVQKRKAADIAAGRLKQSTANTNNSSNAVNNKNNNSLDGEFAFLKWSSNPELERESQRTRKGKDTWRWDRRNKKYDFTCRTNNDDSNDDNVGWQIVETHRKREDAHRDLYNTICNSTRFPGHDLTQHITNENDSNSIKNSNNGNSEKDDECNCSNNNTNKNDNEYKEVANSIIDNCAASSKNLNKNNLLVSSSSTTNNMSSTRRLSQIHSLHESRDEKWRRLHEPHASLPLPHSSSLPNSTLTNSSYWNNTLFDANKVESMLYEELLAEHVNFLSCSGTCMAVMLTGANAIERLLELVGPEDPHDALRLAPHSLHARVGVDLMKNGVYASGSVNEAAVCIEAVFGYASPFADQLKVIDADYVASSQHQSATIGTTNSVNTNNINGGNKGNVFMDCFAKRWGKRVEHTIYDVFAYPPSSILHLPKHTANITLDHSSFGAYNNNDNNNNHNNNYNMTARNSLMPVKLSSMMPHPSNCPPALRLSYYLEEDAVRSFCDDDQWIGLPQTNPGMLASSTSPSTLSPRNNNNNNNNNTKKCKNNNFTDSKHRQVKTTFITDAAEMENMNSNKSNDVKLIDMSEGVGGGNNININSNINSKVDNSSYIMEGSTTNNVSERSPRANVSFVTTKDKSKTWSTRPRSPFPNTATNSANANHNLPLLTSTSSSFTAATTDTQLPRRVLLSDDELSIARSEITKIKRELGLQAKVLHAREMDYLLREHALRRPMEKYVEESKPLATTLAINPAQANSSLHNSSKNNNKFTSGKEIIVNSTENKKNKKSENFSLTYATLRQPFGNALKLVNKTLTYPSEHSNASPTRSTIVPRSPMKASNKTSSKDYSSSMNNNNNSNKKNHLSWQEVYEEEKHQPSTRLGSHSMLNSWNELNELATEVPEKTPNVVLVQPSIVLEGESNISATCLYGNKDRSRCLQTESAWLREKYKTATTLATSKALYAKEPYEFNREMEISEQSDNSNSDMSKYSCNNGQLSPSVSPVSSNTFHNNDKSKMSFLELAPLRPFKFRPSPVIDATNANDLIYSEEARLSLFHSLAQRPYSNSKNNDDVEECNNTVSKHAIITMIKQSPILHPALMTSSSASSMDDAVGCYVNDMMNSDDECNYNAFVILLLRLLKKENTDSVSN